MAVAAVALSGAATPWLVTQSPTIRWTVGFAFAALLIGCVAVGLRSNAKLWVKAVLALGVTAHLASTAMTLMLGWGSEFRSAVQTILLLIVLLLLLGASQKARRSDTAETA